MNDLEVAAKLILADDTLDNLKRWYREMHSPQWDYVIFIARKCYILALILEKITGIPMDDLPGTVYMTDAAFYLRCEKMAEQYRRTGSFPRMLINDDLLLHGRSINHLMVTIENRLCELLYEYERDEVVSALLDAIQINVFMRYDGTLLLLRKYEMRMQCMACEKLVNCHRFSNTVSTLIMCSNIANASYIFSEYLSNEQFERVDKMDFIVSNYHNIKQYTWVKCVEEDNVIKAVLSLRIIKNTFADGYRVLPFVFLPNLDEGETNRLRMEMISAMDYEESNWWTRFDSVEGKRSFNELLTLLLSNVILKEFNEKYSIEQDEEDYLYEIKKLVRNYNDSSFGNTQKYLQECVRIKLFSVAELEQVIRRCISRQRYIIDKKLLNETEMSDWNVREIIEKCFYQKGLEQEKQAYKAKHDIFVLHETSVNRVVSGACFLWQRLLAGFSLENVKKAFAYILHMMDAGVLTLSSYASDRIKVVGFAQYVKEGEMSLFLLPIRLDEYIPMLVQMQKMSEWHNRDLKEEICRYRVEGEHDISEEDWDLVLRFIEEMNEVEQKPSDWDCDFFVRQDFPSDKKQGLEQARDYLSKRGKHLKYYNEYVEKK